MDVLKSLLYLWRYVWDFNKSYVFYAIAYQFTSALLPFSNILMPKYILDELVEQQRMPVLLLYIGILVSANLLLNVASNFLNGRMTTTKTDIYYKFQMMLSRNIAQSDYEQIESAAFLDIKEKAARFLFANGTGFGLIEAALNIIGKVFVFAGIIGILSTLNVWMIAIFAALVLLSSFVESRARKTIAELDLENAKIERKSYYLVTRMEDFRTGKEIRLYHLADYLIEKIRGHFHSAQRIKAKQVTKKNLALDFGAVTTGIRDLIAYLYVVYEVIRGGISIGDFSMYTSAVYQFSSAMTTVMQSFFDIQQYKVYFDAFQQYIHTPKHLRESSGPLPKAPYVLEFDHVSFRYANQEKDALRDVSFRLESGEKLSIVGENGAGKTTLVKLLMRLYDPTQGRILLNGVDIRSIDYDAYQSILAAVFQDFQLFSFTLKENVCFDHAASDEAIRDLLTEAGLGPRLQSLSKGVHTYLYHDMDDEGFSPSGGEAQKIAIARALFKAGARILILDEPTSAMDPRAEFEIYRQFSKLVENRSAVYISHRLSSARFCDHILVLKDGGIAEYGTFQQLYDKGGEFKELYDLQAQFYV